MPRGHPRDPYPGAEQGHLHRVHLKRGLSWAGVCTQRAHRPAARALPAPRPVRGTRLQPTPAHPTPARAELQHLRAPQLPTDPDPPWRPPAPHCNDSAGQGWDARFIEAMLWGTPGGLHQGTAALGVRGDLPGSSITVEQQRQVPQALPGSSFSVTVRLNTIWGEAEGQL